MPVPIAVKKQADKARDLEKKLLDKDKDDNKDDKPQTGEPTQPEPSSTGSQSSSEPATPAEPEPKPEPSSDVWEQRYKTLQGKYNAEIGRLQDVLKTMQAENEFLKGKLATLEDMVKTQSVSNPPAPSQQEDPLAVIKDTLPEVYDALIKYTSQFVKKDEIPDIEKTVENKVQPLVQSTFQATLASLVPDWETLNTDPDFIEWLQRPAPYSDKTLHELMLEYFNQGDAHKVAQFFLDYKKEKQATSQPSANVAPPRRQAAVTQPQSPRLIKRDEIVQFYRDAALGRYSPEQKTQMEAEFIKAIRENRVID